jgi:hypothetical protein
MNADTAPAAAAEPCDSTGRPAVRAAIAADAEATTRVRSEIVGSTPLTGEWARPCTDELASRLTPQGDVRSLAVDTLNVSLAVCALGRIRRVLAAPTHPPGAWPPACSWSPHAAEYRRRGYAGVAVSALLDHLADVEDGR